MKLRVLLLLPLLAYSFGISAYEPEITSDSETVNAVIKTFEDHQLPDNHPIKSKLDQIFSSKVLASGSSLKTAGFTNTKQRRKGLVVTGHPELEGYLLKLYLDTAKLDELEQWMKRINGANLVKNALKKFNCDHLMKVPQKWIYPVPHSGLGIGTNAKKFVLVVEDMDIYSDSETRVLYKSSAITKEHLDALFKVLTSCLLSDSTWLPNIPFSHDGRISFIDTEFAGTSLSIWTRLPRLSKNLNTEMRHYWEKILRENPGPKGLPAYFKNIKESLDDINEAEDSASLQSDLQMDKVDEASIDIDPNKFDLDAVAHI